MQQFDRRRALLWKPAGQASEWDIEYYASRGVLPSETYFSTTLNNENCTAVMNDGFLRLTGQAPNDSGHGAKINIRSVYMSGKSELECAFYVRQFALNSLSLFAGLCENISVGIAAMILPSSITIKRGSYSNQNISRTTGLNTRYVIRLVLDSSTNKGQIYLDDVLIFSYLNNLNTLYNATTIGAISAGYNSTSIVDVEYIKYRNL